jgi:hypothetical protein
MMDLRFLKQVPNSDGEIGIGNEPPTLKRLVGRSASRTLHVQPPESKSKQME